MGDANASIPTVQPVYGQPMWGAHGLAASRNSVFFVSQISISTGQINKYGLQKERVAVKKCRNVKKRDMKLNDRTPKMSVDPESFEVRADGEVLQVPPADKLPLTKAYNLF